VFHCIKNLCDHVVFTIPNPWDEWTKYPNPSHLTTKQEIEKWRKSVKTEHAFISPFSGLDYRNRISQGGKKDEMGNPPTKMYAFIADYDANCTDVMIANIEANPVPNGYMPNYICDSFQKGRKRLIWLFEKEVILGGNYASAVAFAKKVATEIKARNWLPGFDENTLHPRTYFAIGSNWKAVSPMKIPHSVLSLWAISTDMMIQFTDNTISPPPLEKIAELVSDRFPGRWHGDFVLGARGIRFWDAKADNQTAAVVMAEGMRCFTGDFGFVRWEDIFGKKDIDELRGESFGTLRDRILWDTKKFYLYIDEYDEWVSYAKDDIVQHLICCGIDNRAPRGGGPSRVTKFLNEIRMHQRINEALPFVYRSVGKTFYMGEWYLNTAKTKVLPPAPPLQSPGDDFHQAGPKVFPFLHDFMSNFFDPVRIKPKWVPESVAEKDVQLYHFLAWFYRFYKSAHERKPLSGQALIFGGPPGRGKGFMTSGLIAPIMGGAADGSDFLVNDEQWTSEVLQKGLITVDDDTSGDDVRAHRAFTTKLKKMVANPQATYNKKYGNAGRVEWMGRVTITCNLDPDSLRILPDMSQSNADKIMLFLAGHGIDLPNKNELDEIVSREAPHFCRWLIDWKPPKWVLAGDDRYWVRSYHHPLLLEAAAGHGTAANVLEMLREVYDQFVETDSASLNDRGILTEFKDGTRQYKWQGAVRQLLKLMRRLEVPQADRYSYQQIGNMLGVLASRGFKISKLSAQNWEIVFDEMLLSNTTIETEGEKK